MRPLKTKLDRFIAYAEDGEVEKLRAMLDKDPALVNKKWEYGWTALHRASMFGHTDVVRLLIERGAAVHAKDAKRRTPLESAAACKTGLPAMCLIVQAGAAIDNRSTYWETPIMTAVIFGNAENFAYLLGLGARLDLRNRLGLDCFGMIAYQLEGASPDDDPKSDRYRMIAEALEVIKVSNGRQAISGVANGRHTRAAVSEHGEDER